MAEAEAEVRTTNLNRAIVHCAELIVPWLNPAELSSISLTCKSLNHIANSITSRRSSDASRNFENFPIPFVNTVDDHPYAYFIYTPTQTLPSSRVIRHPWGLNPKIRPDKHPVHVAVVEDASGCGCERCDGDLVCPCSYSATDSSELNHECGPSCRCGLDCGNRLTQSGVSARVKIVKNVNKGWGLHADQLIPSGQYVCEYAGELLTTKEARMRQQIYDRLSCGGRFSSALLVVREHLPSRNACMRINIDATKISNVARFINHSCDGGNLSTALVRSSGALLPRLCFFASRDILKDEELTFSYGDSRLQPKGLQCFCGSSCCPGVMPSEHT